MNPGRKSVEIEGILGNSPGPYSSGWFLATPTVRVRYTVERYGKIDLTVL